MGPAESGVVGTTVKRAGQAGLAYYTLHDGDEQQALHEYCRVRQSVYLATCNRVELFFVGEAQQSVHAVRQRFHDFFRQRRGVGPAAVAHASLLRAFAEEGAFEHLCVIAAALDSVVPGEAQILGQVKSALHTAQTLGLCGPLLRDWFVEAFAVAKQVRTHTPLGQGRVSMFSLATELIEQRAQSVGTELGMAIVGVGEMSVLAAQWAQQHLPGPVWVVNRTLHKAEAIAAPLGAHAMTLARFVQAPPPAHVVLCATASPQPVLQARTLQQLPTHALLIDLAVHRDVDGAAAHACGCEVWDIDRLQARARAHVLQRRAHMAEARQWIDQALERYRQKRLHRQLGAALKHWRAHSQSVLCAELKKWEAATTDEQQAVHAFGQRLLGQLLHAPTVALKEVAQRHGAEAVDTFVRAGRFDVHRKERM